MDMHGKWNKCVMLTP